MLFSLSDFRWAISSLAVALSQTGDLALPFPLVAMDDITDELVVVAIGDVTTEDGELSAALFTALPADHTSTSPNPYQP